MSNDSRQFIYADAQNLETFRSTFFPRFENIQTVPGTRKFHYVEPFQGRLRCKILAKDNEFFEFDLRRQISVNLAGFSYDIGGFVGIKTNAAFVVGRIAAVEQFDGTLTLHIMKQLGGKNNFLWPVVDQQLHASPQELICKLNQPVLVGRSHRYSALDTKEFELLRRLSQQA